MKCISINYDEESLEKRMDYDFYCTIIDMASLPYEMRNFDELIDNIQSKKPPIKPSDYLEKNDNGIPFVRIGEVSYGGINCHLSAKVSKVISKDFLKHYNEKDLIISKSGTIGKIAIIKDKDLPLIISHGFFTIKPKKSIDPYYLLLALLSEIVQKQLQALKKGTAIQTINIQDTKSIKIPFLSKNKQIEIANKMELLLTIKKIIWEISFELKNKATEYENRNNTFLIKYKDLSIDRLDVQFYKSKTEDNSKTNEYIKLADLLEIKNTISYKDIKGRKSRLNLLKAVFNDEDLVPKISIKSTRMTKTYTRNYLYKIMNKDIIFRRKHIHLIPPIIAEIDKEEVYCTNEYLVFRPFYEWEKYPYTLLYYLKDYQKQMIRFQSKRFQDATIDEIMNLWVMRNPKLDDIVRMKITKILDSIDNNYILQKRQELINSLKGSDKEMLYTLQKINDEVSLDINRLIKENF